LPTGSGMVCCRFRSTSTFKPQWSL